MTVGSNGPQTLFEGTITFSSVAANTAATQTVTLPSGAFNGATGAGGASMHLSLPNLQSGLLFSNACAINPTQFTVVFYNTTGGALTPTGTAAKLIQF